jgi:hypothetical protein
MEPARAATAVCSLPHALPGLARDAAYLAQIGQARLALGRARVADGLPQRASARRTFPDSARSAIRACPRTARPSPAESCRRLRPDIRPRIPASRTRREGGFAAPCLCGHTKRSGRGETSRGARGAVEGAASRPSKDNFPRRFKRGRVACGRRDSDDDFEPSALRISTSAAPACFAARIARATSACVIAAGRRLTIASLGLSWRNLR